MIWHTTVGNHIILKERLYETKYRFYQIVKKSSNS